MPSVASTTIPSQNYFASGTQGSDDSQQTLCHQNTMPVEPIGPTSPVFGINCSTSSAVSTQVHDEEPLEHWVRPPIVKTLKGNSRLVAIILGLAVLFAGLLAGMIVFVVNQNHLQIGKDKKKGGDGGEIDSDNGQLSPVILVIDGLFIIAVIIVLALLVRQCFALKHLFLPPSRLTSSSQSILPSWLFPALPTYVDAVGERRPIGGIANRCITEDGLPQYGNNRGSKLLLKSESQGSVAVAGVGVWQDGVSPRCVVTQQMLQQGSDGLLTYERSQAEALRCMQPASEPQSVEDTHNEEKQTQRQTRQRKGSIENEKSNIRDKIV
ncbi:hypothetical protein L204_100694 [Cryptococcus depauperatus]|nr:hypothetical protein L204_01374 [Cryptococcus depauperatus CBS 7855]